MRATPLAATKRPYSLGPEGGGWKLDEPDDGEVEDVWSRPFAGVGGAAAQVPLPPFLPLTVPPTGPTAEMTLKDDEGPPPGPPPSPFLLNLRTNQPRPSLLVFLIRPESPTAPLPDATLVLLAKRGGGTETVGGGWYESGEECWWWDEEVEGWKEDECDEGARGC